MKRFDSLREVRWIIEEVGQLKITEFLHSDRDLCFSSVIEISNITLNYIATKLQRIGSLKYQSSHKKVKLEVTLPEKTL